jgi:hypothetical protein
MKTDLLIGLSTTCHAKALRRRINSQLLTAWQVGVSHVAIFCAVRDHEESDCFKQLVSRFDWVVVDMTKVRSRSEDSRCDHETGAITSIHLIRAKLRETNKSVNCFSNVITRVNEHSYFAMQTFFGSVKKRSASSPPSRPTPLCFIPPNGTRRSRTSQQFTQTVPV